VPGTEVDEAVVVCLIRPLRSGCSRIRKAICSRKCEVTIRQSAVRHSQQEYLADEKLLDTATGMNQIGKHRRFCTDSGKQGR
jgi:hypothetical protein